MSFFSKMISGQFKYPGTDVAITGKDSKLNSGWDTAQFLNFSPLNPIAPVHVVNSGIQTYKETGNLGKTLLDPSGDDPLEIVGHKYKKGLQADIDRHYREVKLPKIREQMARKAAKQRAKNRNTFGMSAGGATSTSQPRKKTTKPSRCGVGGYYRKR